MTPYPALFLGHGSPMNAIEQNRFHLEWRALGQSLPRPKAILCVSAHWETHGIKVSGSEAPETIHDFGGFPQALFDVVYPAPGAPWLAARTAELLKDFGATIDPERGLDHGSWGVLTALYPDADVPVIQLSLDRARSPQEHYQIAKALRPLRDEGIMILASGDIVHNLRAIDFRNPTPLDWAVRFNDQVKDLIARGQHQPLIDYLDLGQDAALSINSAEHYLPLLYTLGVSDPGESLRFVTDEVFAALSMTGLVYGD